MKDSDVSAKEFLWGKLHKTLRFDCGTLPADALVRLLMESVEANYRGSVPQPARLDSLQICDH